MPTLWIHGGLIPPCPFCRRAGRGSGPAVAGRGSCRVVLPDRMPPADWVDELVPIRDADLKARNAAMVRRARERELARSLLPAYGVLSAGD